MAEQATVNVLHHPPGIKPGCAKCRKTLASGTFAIGVSMGNHRYVVGHNPPIMCCDEEKKVPLLYDNEPLAAFAANGVVETLEKDGTTANLRLFEMAQFISTAAH